MSADRAIKQNKPLVITKIKNKKMKTSVQKINDSMMNIIQNAGTKKMPISKAKARTNATKAVISLARVELATNDVTGENNKPDILK